MKKIGRNDPCPSAAGVKFKKCLKNHPQLSERATAPLVWWVCDRWQAGIPDTNDLNTALAQINPIPEDKLQKLLEMVFESPGHFQNWELLLFNCSQASIPDLPDLFRQMLPHVKAQGQLALLGFLAAAVDCFQNDHPEMYSEVFELLIGSDPQDVDHDTLGGVARWAEIQGRKEDLERLAARFPRQAEMWPSLFGGESSGMDSLEVDNTAGETSRFPPEIERQLDTIWDEFNEIDNPSREQRETFVDRLLALPHEATDWSDVYEACIDGDHFEVSHQLFERIVSPVSHDANRSLAYVYWKAMEQAAKWQRPDLMPGIARGFRRIKEGALEYSAWSHVADYLRGEGLVEEWLELLRHGLPIIRTAPPDLALETAHITNEIRLIRCGNLIASGDTSEPQVQRLAGQLVEEIGREWDVPFLRTLTGQLTGMGPETFSREDFKLTTSKDEGITGREEIIRLQRNLFCVARDRWKMEDMHPATLLAGLDWLIEAIDLWESNPRLKKRPPNNMLDCLSPKYIDPLASSVGSEVLGINVPRAKLFLSALRIFTRWAADKNLIPENQKNQTEAEIDKLLFLTNEK